MPRVKISSLFRRTSESWNLSSGATSETNDTSGSIRNSNGPGPLSAIDASNWEKFKLLLWKNYKIQVRHKIQTLVEVILPILFTAIVVVVRCLLESHVVPEPTIFHSFDLNEVPFTPKSCCNEIYYTPKNEVVQRLMSQVHRDFFNKSDFNLKFTGFDNETELEVHYQSSTSSIMNTRSDDLSQSSPVLAGVVFTNVFPNDDFPSDIKYKIRFPATPRASSDFFGDRFGIKKIWFTETMYPIVQLLGPRAADQSSGGVPGYYEEGFLYIQYAVETTLAKLLSKNDNALDAYDIKLQRFPYPSHVDDKFLYTLQGVLPLTLILSFIYPVINITKSVVVEKEKRLKEYMKLMGLPNWLHWTAWFIKSFLFLATSTVVIVILLKVRVTESQILEVFPKSDPTLIFVAFMTHIFQLVCFAFFISTLFKTANSAAIVAAILWFMFFIPFAFLQPRYNQIPRFGKIAWSFGTNIGVCFCCQILCMFEGTGVGAQWNTVLNGATPDDPFSLGDCMLVMIVNGVFYLALTFYMEAVRPGEFGIPLPWYFPFTTWYWTGAPRVKVNWSSDIDSDRKDAKRNTSRLNTSQTDYFESVTSKSKPGIQIKDLSKMFGEKVAVKNLNLNMFEDETFVLLGPNAAGKTTTMSILAGIYPPSSGTALINGFDICKDIKAVRCSLGLCPQSNVLFSELTVEEHLRFYSVLKGLSKSEVDFEVKRMIAAIGLQRKKDTVATALSGGMKRRLSVGIAFCAQSKVVLLDEPSSGLDVGARRAIWDLIEKEKKGRTILLTTHYMDEADILGDRIAIMAEGELQCCGSSLFLKKKYGCGYHLVIVKEPGCNVQNITNILKSKLEDVEEEQNVGAELSYALPDNKSHLFAEVFEELEKRKVELGIASYGASITTMEEVFMRVGQLFHKKDPEVTTSPYNNGSNQNHYNNSDLSKSLAKKPSDVTINLNVTFLNGSKMSLNTESQGRPKPVSNFWLRLQQFRAMVVKKTIFTQRKYGLLLGQIAICLIYPTLVLFVLTTIPGLYDPPPRIITLNDYEYFGKVTTTLHCPEESSICTGYKNYLHSKDKLIEQVSANETLDKHILEMASKDVTYVNFKYIIGYEEGHYSKINSTNKTEVVGYFNNQPLHTPPLALNFITNAILNSLPKSPNTSSNPNSINAYAIQVTNHPFQYGPNFEELGSYFTIGFQVGLHFSLAIGFMVAIYTIFPIKERSLGSKHLQFVSGVNFISFWAANFLVDLVAYFIPCLVIHLILIGYQVQDFYSVTVQLYLLLLFYCYAFAVLPMMYLSSLFFRIPSSGLVGMGVFNVLTGYATLFVANILDNPELEKGSLSTSLHRIFMVIPTYALGKGITQISLNYQVTKQCTNILGTEFYDNYCDVPEDQVLPQLSWCCTKLKDNYLDWEEFGIGKNLVYLSIFGTVCWILLLIIDSGTFSKVFGRFARKIEKIRIPEGINSKSFGTEDEDVSRERKRIQNSKLEQLCATDNLVLRDLTKMFPNGTLAVDRTSLGVKKGECFGLLGANGAGKTTTFKLLTGELQVTSGDAYIYGNSIRTHLQQSHRNMGYCPQFDSLIEEMTGRETLWMYARLRGIPENGIHKVVSKLAEDLVFTQFLDNTTGSYSGGNKRKLSTACALLGNPPIVFLDEPTCGIDPVARRHLWDCIARIRDSGTSVILTSHSMEETEFLCTRLAIMVNGKFRCLGSPQQLKSKFGEGYTLTAQTTINDSDIIENDALKRRRRTSSHVSIQEVWRSKLGDLRGFIEASLPGCSLEDIHQGFLHYRVRSDKVTWAQMFTVMEAAKEKFNVEAYSVGQTSLEQVFLNFIKAQYKTDGQL